MAIGIARSRTEKDFRLAVRVQRQQLYGQALVEAIQAKAQGEADIRMVGRVAKQVIRELKVRKPMTFKRFLAGPWYQQPTRPWRTWTRA